MAHTCRPAKGSGGRKSQGGGRQAAWAKWVEKCAREAGDEASGGDADTPQRHAGREEATGLIGIAIVAKAKTCSGRSGWTP